MTSKKANPRPSKNLPATFDKHFYYEASVQNVSFDVEFLRDQYAALTGRAARSLREDFCGTGALMCEWVKQHPENTAMGIDLDPEPVEWGKKHHHAKLSEQEQGRVNYVLGNVLDTQKHQADIICAFNFSYFIFKKRAQLVDYFSRVRKALKPGGVFFIDLFGGPESQILQEEETEHDNFSYYWDCDKFNPITNECLYYIHFKVGGKKYRKAFTYDWRLWGLAELRDILEDAGFSKTVAFWEGDDEENETGDGEFYISEEEENCESWVTYIAALA